MEITVVSEEENPMLHRTDVTFRVSHVEATPDRLAVRDSLAARLNKDADEVVIRKLDTKFGMRTTYGEAKVYESPVEAKEVEQAYMLERNKIAVGEGGEAEVEEPDADEAEDVADEPEGEDEPEESDAEPEPEEAVDEPEAEEPETDEETETDAEADEETEAEADEETETEPEAAEDETTDAEETEE